MIPDTLSRAYLDIIESELSGEEMKAYIHQIKESFPMSDKKLNIYQEATADDVTLQLLAKYVRDGWPTKENIRPSVKPYYNIRDDPTLLDGLVLKGTCIIVPTTLHKDVPDLIHIGLNALLVPETMCTGPVSQQK